MFWAAMSLRSAERVALRSPATWPTDSRGGTADSGGVSKVSSKSIPKASLFDQSKVVGLNKVKFPREVITVSQSVELVSRVSQSV